MATLKLFDDPRPIQEIWFGDGLSYTVGYNGVTQIECYEEYGQGAFVPWFAVYIGERLAHRVNGAHVKEVSYGEDDPNVPQS